MSKFVVDTGNGFRKEIEADSFDIRNGVLIFDNEDGDYVAGFAYWRSVTPAE